MSSVDWRRAPWLAPLDDADEHRRFQHERALAILDAFEQEARPFALLLSTYGTSELYGDDGDGYGESLFANLVGRGLSDRGVEVIAVQDQSNLLASASGPSSMWFGQKIAALRLTNEAWLDAVRELMRRAELIVCECQFQTPGLALELAAIDSLHRHDRTIVLLPVSPPFASLDDSELIASFPRAVHADEMDWKAPLGHFVFSDLVERATNIAHLPAAERLALVRGGQLDARFPITGGDLLGGFETLASAQQKAGRQDRVAFCYSRLTQIARQSADGRFLALYLAQWAQARWVIGDFRGSLASVLEAEQTLARVEASSPAPPGAVLTAAAMRERKSQMVLNPAQAFLAKNQTEELFAFLTELLEPVREWNDLGLEALCLSKWAEGEIRADRIDDAQKTIDRVLELAGRTGDRFREAFATYLRGLGLTAGGDESGAVSAFERALSLLPRPGVYEVEWAIFMNLGRVTERRGDPEAALQFYAAAEACADALGHANQRTTAAEARKRLAAPL